MVDAPVAALIKSVDALLCRIFCDALLLLPDLPEIPDTGVWGSFDAVISDLPGVDGPLTEDGDALFTSEDGVVGQRASLDSGSTGFRGLQGRDDNLIGSMW
mmetsp:Transcript_82516/g.151076  ORF Transcript_82516/g.151076 Transcript_82516/m.151076 type:complete len:101 (+) Transcript_82516:82-384(+)